MPRPKNKKELLSAGTDNYEKLLEVIDSFTDAQRHAKYTFDNKRDKNIRDIITHLHQWHLMVIEWHKVGMTGKKPTMPAQGYTWKTTKDLNKKIWKDYQDTDYETAMRLFKKSFRQMKNTIEGHTDKELFTKKKYVWTGSTSMGSYFVSATSSHYDWALKLLKKYKKSLL